MRRLCELMTQPVCHRASATRRCCLRSAEADLRRRWVRDRENARAYRLMIFSTALSSTSTQSGHFNGAPAASLETWSLHDSNDVGLECIGVMDHGRGQ